MVYLLLSILCSGINEWIAQKTRRRGRFLRAGLLNLIGDRWMYTRLINHPLVSVHYRGQPGQASALPSYLPADSVVKALLDVIVKKASQMDPSFAASDPSAKEFKQIRAALLHCHTYGYSIAGSLLPLLDQAEGDLERAQKAIAAWYEGAMDRVSGWYKMQARNRLFIIGLIVAVLLNVDTLAMTRQLLSSDALRQSLMETASQTVQLGELKGVSILKDGQPISLTEGDLKTLASVGIELERQGLPLGFSCLAAEDSSSVAVRPTILRRCLSQVSQAFASSQGILIIIGWLITALAISLGGPFWFDLLNRLVDLRGAGKTPAAQRQDPST
ncbi:MAG: hypothetical protein KDK04_06950 [Candidatus Competibacteraceae bacterium]|nr:hypothetical protein [Candidatus Competibacteraceae bacterium]